VGSFKGIGIEGLGIETGHSRSWMERMTMKARLNWKLKAGLRAGF
jgi:hypothetical protein